MLPPVDPPARVYQQLVRRRFTVHNNKRKYLDADKETSVYWDGAGLDSGDAAGFPDWDSQIVPLARQLRLERSGENKGSDAGTAAAAAAPRFDSAAVAARLSIEIDIKDCLKGAPRKPKAKAASAACQHPSATVHRESALMAVAMAAGLSRQAIDAVSRLPAGAAADVAGGKRQSRAYFFVECHTNLPEQLTLAYLERHGYCRADAEKLLEHADAEHLWLLARLLQIDITASAIQPCASAKDSMSVSANASLVEKLLDEIEARIAVPNKSTCSFCPHDPTLPKLPVHLVTEAELKQLPAPARAARRSKSDGCDAEQAHQDTLLEAVPASYSAVVRFAGAGKPDAAIEALPLQYHCGYVQMVRVVPKRAYEQTHGTQTHECADTAPDEFLVAGRVYCALGERYLLQTASSHQALCGLVLKPGAESPWAHSLYVPPAAVAPA